MKTKQILRTSAQAGYLAITLVVAGISPSASAATSTWTGTTNGTWDTTTAANWGGTAFTSSNDALFTGTPTNNVTTATGLTIGAITLDNTYTGSVTMTGPNTVSGATTISGATLTLTSATGTGTSAITVNNGGILQLGAGSAAYANAASGAGVATVVTNAAGDATLTDAWSGFTGTLNLNGSGNFQTRFITTQSFEYGSDLTGWTALNITAPTAAAVILGTPSGGEPNLQTVTVPKGANTKLFGRLRVVK